MEFYCTCWNIFWIFWIWIYINININIYIYYKYDRISIRFIKGYEKFLFFDNNRIKSILSIYLI